MLLESHRTNKSGNTTPDVNLRERIPSILIAERSILMENVLNDTVRAALSTQALSIAEFDEVVRTHQRRVYRVMVLLVRDPDKDTLTQECFLRAYQSLSRFRENAASKHGFYGSQSISRRITLATAGLVFEAVSGLSTDHNQAQTLEFPALTRRQRITARPLRGASRLGGGAISSQQQRTIFALRFVEELELNEIAEILGLQVGSVKTHLFRAVHAVRNKLKEQQWR
jgi:RNA polymerase sigma-70 factor (ECF subfamily)